MSTGAITMPETTSFCVGLRVRDAIKRMPNRELKCLFVDKATGKTLSADAAKEVLLDQLSKGHEIIPLGPCDNFDYGGKGCLGHRKECR